MPYIIILNGFPWILQGKKLTAVLFIHMSIISDKFAFTHQNSKNSYTFMHNNTKESKERLEEILYIQSDSSTYSPINEFIHILIFVNFKITDRIYVCSYVLYAI